MLMAGSGWTPQNRPTTGGETAFDAVRAGKRGFMVQISYKLEHFEGPLDLLLHLIEKNKVNIYDIPIAEITNQYLEYVRNMEREDLNVVS